MTKNRSSMTRAFLLLLFSLGCSSFLISAATESGASAFSESLAAQRDAMKAGHYSECEAGARELLSQAESSAGSESSEVEQVLEILIGCLWRGGKAGESETMDLAVRGLELAEVRFGKESLEAARSANNLGNIHLQRGDLSAARLQWNRVLAIREKLLGPEHPDVAGTLNNLAIAAEQAGDYQGAKALSERSVAIREKALGPEHPDVATSLNNLGTVLGRLGDFEGERSTQERALAIYEKAIGPDHPNIANVLDALCKTEVDLYDLAAARTRCEQTLAMRERTLGSDHPDVAKALDNLALVLVELEDSGDAVAKLERALAIQEQALGTEHPDVAYSLEILARTRFRMGKPQEAIPLYQRALAIEEKSFGPGHPRVAEIVAALAQVYADLGDTAARPLFQRAMKTFEATLPPDSPSVANVLVDLGSLESRAGHFDAAEPLFLRALSIREKSYGGHHPVVAEVLQRMIPLDRARGDVSAQLGHSLRAAGILREHFRRLAQGVSEREALRYRESLDTSLDDALSLLASARPQALSATEAVMDELIRSRAVVLDEMGARHHSIPPGEAGGTHDLAEALRASRNRLARVLIRGPEPGQSEAYLKQLRDVEAAEDRAERDLAAASGAFSLQRARSHAGLKEIKEALPPRAALVAYALYHRPPAAGTQGLASERSSAYLAFVLSAGSGKISVVPLAGTKGIDTLVEDWRRELMPPPESLAEGDHGAEARYRDVGGRLRKAIWDPVAPHLSGSKQVLIVPEGALNLVSMDSLPNDSGRYLAETAPLLHRLSAERDLLHPSPGPSRGRGLLSLGGPDFDAFPGAPLQLVSGAPSPEASAPDKPEAKRGATYRSPRPVCSDFRSLRFEPLPGAAAEVSEIDTLWSKGMTRDHGKQEASLVLTGAAASEDAFKHNAPEHRIVHVATHGFFLTDRCGSTPEENPLLLSGLALAGANRRMEVGRDAELEDGILTAEEIASLDLSASDWLVLSGCDTGSGRAVGGEGVLGLGRAFQIAGARTLIMSLWRVEDAATREWMRRLYEARGQGASTAQAMRQANLATLRARRDRHLSAHPFYWGAFIAAGDWR